MGAARIIPACVLCAGAFIVIASRPAQAAQIPAEVIQDLERVVAPRSGVACPDARAYSLARPDPAGRPTVVGLAAYFQDVAQLNDVEQTMDLDVYVIARWRDPRLADETRGDGSADCAALAGDIWVPALEPMNLRARQLFYADRFLVDQHGVVTLGRRLWIKVANPLDFRDFPLDAHEWVFTIWPVVSRSDEVVFHPIARLMGIASRLSIQGWRVGVPRASASTTTRDGRAGTYARFDATLEVRRTWVYYAWKLGLPLTLIVLMAYGVYFIPASAVPQQVGLGMTAMLTLIAYMLMLGNTLPRISYLTRADWFFIGSALLVFLGLMKAVVTLALAQGPRANLIPRADWWGRVLYPVAMLANFALAFLT
jgi:hypothetical protein